MADLQIKSQVLDGIPVVRLTGEIDSLNATHVKTVLDALVEADHPSVLIDMVALADIDSSGLGVLVAALKKTTDRDGTISLIDPPTDVATMLSITGLDKLFSIFGDEAEALSSARRSLVS